jgi:hypothetical protein
MEPGSRHHRSIPEPAGLGPIRRSFREQGVALFHLPACRIPADVVFVRDDMAVSCDRQFFGGVVRAGLGLGLNNYVFDTVQLTDRAKAVAISSVVNAIGSIMGTIIESWLISTVPATLQVGTVTLELVSNLPSSFFPAFSA